MKNYLISKFRKKSTKATSTDNNTHVIRIDESDAVSHPEVGENNNNNNNNNNNDEVKLNIKSIDEPKVDKNESDNQKEEERSSCTSTPTDDTNMNSPVKRRGSIAQAPIIHYGNIGAKACCRPTDYESTNGVRRLSNIVLTSEPVNTTPSGLSPIRISKYDEDEEPPKSTKRRPAPPIPNESIEEKFETFKIKFDTWKRIKGKDEKSNQLHAELLKEHDEIKAMLATTPVDDGKKMKSKPEAQQKSSTLLAPVKKTKSESSRNKPKRRSSSVDRMFALKRIQNEALEQIKREREIKQTQKNPRIETAKANGQAPSKGVKNVEKSVISVETKKIYRNGLGENEYRPKMMSSPKRIEKISIQQDEKKRNLVNDYKPALQQERTRIEQNVVSDYQAITTQTKSLASKPSGGQLSPRSPSPSINQYRPALIKCAPQASREELRTAALPNRRFPEYKPLRIEEKTPKPPPIPKTMPPVNRKLHMEPVYEKPSSSTSTIISTKKITVDSEFRIADILAAPKLRKVGMPVEKSGISLGKVVDSCATTNKATPAAPPPPPPPPPPPQFKTQPPQPPKMDIRENLMLEIRQAGKLRAARLTQSAD